MVIRLDKTIKFVSNSLTITETWWTNNSSKTELRIVNCCNVPKQDYLQRCKHLVRQANLRSYLLARASTMMTFHSELVGLSNFSNNSYRSSNRNKCNRLWKKHQLLKTEGTGTIRTSLNQRSFLNWQCHHGHHQLWWTCPSYQYLWTGRKLRSQRNQVLLSSSSRGLKYKGWEGV